jgi:predicted nuclease of predicted toxin-antitoxin system
MQPSWLAQDHDALHANELSLNRAADTEILSMALADGRVVVTADLDFPGLLAMLGAVRLG